VGFGLGAEPIVEGVRDVEDDLGVFLAAVDSRRWRGGSGELVGDVARTEARRGEMRPL